MDIKQTLIAMLDLKDKIDKRKDILCQRISPSILYTYLLYNKDKEYADLLNQFNQLRIDLAHSLENSYESMGDLLDYVKSSIDSK